MEPAPRRGLSPGRLGRGLRARDPPGGRVLVALLVALLVAALPHRGAARVRDDCTTGVYGVVRAEATGDSSPGAGVESPAARVAASADGTGRYALCLAKEGHHLVRFGALGYEARLVDVRVRPGARLRLDVALGAAPARLGPVRIVAS